MTISFVDLKAQYKAIKSEIDSEIQNVLRSTDFIQGQHVEEFEKEYSHYNGVAHCISVNSGTDALILGMRALELTRGGEIIVAANTYISTALSASENGLKPVFVDIDDDFGMDLSDLKRKINSRTVGIAITHLYGQADKVEEINDIIKKTQKKILVIEDACQAHGAYYKKRRVGSFGVFGAFSFYPGKNLGAYGDGGAIITNDSKLAKKYRLLREYGQTRKYIHKSIGVNSRLDTLQAAVLRVKLKHLDEWNLQRQKLASYYTNCFKNELPFVQTPKEFQDRKSIYHLYVIRTKKRDALQKYLVENGVKVQIHYPIPVHLQNAYKYLGYNRGDIPYVEKISNEILSLPIYPELTKEMVKYIVNMVKRFYQQ